MVEMTMPPTFMSRGSIMFNDGSVMFDNYWWIVALDNYRRRRYLNRWSYLGRPLFTFVLVLVLTPSRGGRVSI